MTSISLTECSDTDELVRLLFDAYPNETALRSLLVPVDTVSYSAWGGKKVIGAVSVRWDKVSEILLLSVVEKQRGRGFGKAILEAVLCEASKREVKTMLVGTGNYAVGNMIFYQKCGFRMCSIRRDHFAQTKPPLYYRDIALTDMVVLERQVL